MSMRRGLSFVVMTLDTPFGTGVDINPTPSTATVHAVTPIAEYQSETGQFLAR